MRHPAPGQWRSDTLSQGFVGDYKPFMFVDGEGVRCSLYVSGCLFACEGCFNRATWSFRYGNPYTAELEDRILADLAQPYVQGLTLLGGEPFLNTGVCLALVRRVRAQFGRGKDIWSWTGYTYEQLLLETDDKLELLGQLDVLVDGPFDESLKDLRLQFRGSSNQRIIDVPASLAAGHMVLWAARVDATQSYEQLQKQALI
jgi:anaerobic ribonucleoside-triphosphate reductase activating protein